MYQRVKFVKISVATHCETGAVGHCLSLGNTRLEAALTGSQDGCLHRVAARFQRASVGGILAANRYNIPLHPFETRIQKEIRIPKRFPKSVAADVRRF